MRMDRERKTRRQDLLQAAEEIFARKGFHSATLDEIVKTACTGKGTLYHYFDSKEDLFYAVIERIQQTLLDEMRGIIDTDMPPPAKIEELMVIYVRWLRHYADLWRVLYSELPRKHGKPCEHGKERLRNRFRPIAKLIEGVLEEGRLAGQFTYPDPHITARILCTAASIYTMHGTDDSVPADGRTVAQLILYGISSRGDRDEGEPGHQPEGE